MYKPIVTAAEQSAAADQQQLGSIDLGCHLAAYFGGWIGPGQRCCWPLNADPLYGAHAMSRAVTGYWPPAPPRLVAISSALVLFATSAVSLLLYPTLFSATPDASPADVVDLNSWLDLPASVAALAVTLRPFAGDLLLGRPANFEWRASGLFRTPPNAVQSYQPAILFLGALVGLYSLVALFSTINAVLYLSMGELSWHSILQGVLRPVIAWVLVVRVVRQMGTPSTGSAPNNEAMKSDVE